MAYAESTIGGSMGGQFRCWVNSIRTHDGNQADNTEDWRVEGGVKRVTSGSRVWNNYNQATFTIQLGMNGVATSGNFNYDTTGAGNIGAWGTGATKVSRSSAGTGFGFQSRTDINMSNSPYLTSGWVTSNDSVQTKPRYGDIDVITGTPAGALTDETTSIFVDWHKYVGTAHIWFRLDLINNSDATHHKIGMSDPYTWTGWQSWLKTSMVNTNSTTLYIYYGDDLDSNGSVDRWDTPNTYTITIKNDTGQANPTFVDFDYLDVDSAAVAVTGSNQVLIQGKSDLEVNVDSTDKATANKSANMVSYTFSIGGYSQSEPWSNTVDVPKDIGIISDVTGDQTLNVRAIDSRGNGTTVTKNVTILPYFSPGFYNNLDVKYANDFDNDDGIALTLFDTDVIGTIAPMTLSGTDKNAVTPTTGLRFDMAKDTGSFTGTWTNIAFTTDTNTGLVNVTPATLATQIETKMNGMGADNTVRWYVLFQIVDKLETQYYTVEIDVGRPFFRIGADGRLYYKEIEFFQTFSGDSSLYYSSLLGIGTTGTWTYGVPAAARAGGWSMLANTTGAAINDECYVDLYVPAGSYFLTFYFDGSTTSGQIELDLDHQITFTSAFETYLAAPAQVSGSTSGINFLDGATYRMYFVVTGKHASSTSYQCRLLGIKLTNTSFVP